MSIKNYIFFTEVITILNEVGEKKLKKATSTSQPKDENGFTAEWYEDMGLPIPDSLVDDRPEIDEEGFMKLEEGEFTYDFQNRFIDMKGFSGAVEADEFGTVIEFYDGRSYWIEEDLFEVYTRIYLSQMNWFEKIKESVFNFFREIKNKLTKENGKQN